jgi:hypothetical protein
VHKLGLNPEDEENLTMRLAGAYIFEDDDRFFWRMKDEDIYSFRAFLKLMDCYLATHPNYDVDEFTWLEAQALRYRGR